MVVAHGISELYEMVPGFIAACVAILVVSRLGRAPSDAVQFRHKSMAEFLLAVWFIEEVARAAAPTAGGGGPAPPPALLRLWRRRAPEMIRMSSC